MDSGIRINVKIDEYNCKFLLEVDINVDLLETSDKWMLPLGL